ncbi:glycosyltransferase [Paenibacillus lautus]|uniref:glycosyltransferase n=1 Tax=Paenibacillus lautus TaxID=1401 RepID=UPI003D2A9780
MCKEIMVVLKIKKVLVQMIYKVIRLIKPLLMLFIPAHKRNELKRKFLSLSSSSSRERTIESLQFIKGINLIGFSRAEMGIGESCRIAANSMNAADIPFGIINFIGTNSARMGDMTWVHKEITSPIYSINIFHINAEQMPELNAIYSDSFFKNRYNIGVWHWELPDFPDEWMGSFQFVDEIWAPSTFVAESISLKSPVPVVKIPHSIEVKIASPRTRAYYNLPEDVFLFLTMYDVRSFQERKNPEASIRSFQLAFKPDNMSVGLVIKVNSYKANTHEMDKLNKLISDYNNIYIMDETLSRNDVNALLFVSDCFISLHRSEGFGLGLAEAMYLGKPVIGTNWSSTTDFMKSNNSCPVNYRMISVGKDYGPYKAYQQWADPDIEQASEYMKKLVIDPDYYHTVASQGEKYIKQYYSPKYIGEMMNRRIDYIRKWRFGG